NERINRINYEISVLQALRERLRCKEIWVVGANRYRNPEEDLPADFELQREAYYQALKQPTRVEDFITPLKQAMMEALNTLNDGLPKNSQVEILKKNNGWIRLSPLDKQPEPTNILRLKTELIQRWPMTSLLDILKEADLRIDFTKCFNSVASREALDQKTLQKRLLLCLYGLGTNTGLKRVSDGTSDVSYYDLRYIKRRFIHKEQLRNAIAKVVNAIFRIRLPQIWGEGTTTCASDSKKFGAWEQNLMTEWHIRYGGRGVMIYWHVEKKSTCIYSQLKTCSSSEVAAMIEGVLRHDTEMTVKKNFVDSHGQSEVAFAFCHLLGFQLMPRLKAIHRQKLYRPETGSPNAYPNLQLVLTRPIDWELIRQQYDQMIKYATALRLGTAEPEAILKRFTRSNIKHPTYQALGELGKVIKTIFLCQYLYSLAMRREINEGLNVVENWNSTNGFIFYGKSGEIATNQRSEQEIAVLSLHLLQISLVYINTLMLQQVLSEPAWSKRLTTDDQRALTPLIYGHVNPYGTFQLDLTKRLKIDYKLEVAG
uniref:Tn3 family transposase n=1 Tax=Scytonema sp. PCC 10023 TaxID=1680591 RepID=UPI0039C704D0